MALFDALGKGADFIDQLQKGRILDVQAKYADPMMAGNLFKLQTQNKFLPDKLRMANEYQGLVNKWYSPRMQADIESENAGTRRTNTMLPWDVKKAEQEVHYTPLNEAIKLQNAIRMGSRFGDAYALHQQLASMPKAARDSWIADHSDEYNNMINALANSATNPKNDFLGGMAGQYFPGAAQPASPQPGALQQPAATQQPGGLAAPPQPVPQFASSPESTERLKLASQMSANNDLIGNKAKTQGQAAVNLDNWLNENQADYSQKINNISKYAGAIGKGNLTLDALKKDNPKAYQDWQWFNNTLKNNIDALLTQMEGLSINEGQQKRLIQLSSGMFNNMTTDPKSAVNQFNEFIKMTKEISKQRTRSAQPLYKDTYNKAFGHNEENKPYVSKYNAQELQKWADEAISKGASESEVKKRMQELLNG